MSGFVSSSGPIGAREEQRTVYPKIGRLLTKDDEGKKIIRVFPKIKPEDWSYCYYKGCNIEGSSTTLQKISACSILILNGFGEAISSTFSNDGYWTTTEELFKYLESNHQDGVKHTIRYEFDDEPYHFHEDLGIFY